MNTPETQELTLHRPVATSELMMEVERRGNGGGAMQITEILDQVRLIQEVMTRVMKEGEHYGKIPGCGDKPALLKAGAEKLGMTFRLAPTFDIRRDDLPGGHREYQVVCTLNARYQGVGACSTMESKYRYRKADLSCPNCGKPTIIKGKAEFGGGWICFAKKGGCGTKWTDHDNPFKHISFVRVEHDNPADYFNTVLKMAKKRAHVDAVLTATAASDIFVQDIEETIEDTDGNSVSDKSSVPVAKAQPKATIESINPPAKPVPQPVATEATRKWMLDHIEAFRDSAKEYAEKHSILLPTESLEDWPLEKVPTSKPSLMQLIGKIEAFASGEADSPPPDDAPKAPEGERVTGVIEMVSSKETKKKGVFRYGIKVAGVWYNSFDTKHFEFANANKGGIVTVTFKVGEYGNDILAIA